ncbi:hypothetical protein WJX72_001458 [[Myrmecia] bisecta]|uniref:F-box domain-containing protein n=1 Tax=[Myrmecia] bisecta TaxID=41462 RepID=A0AAW1R4V4_9CHLO
MDSLSEEVLQHVLSFLPLKEQARCAAPRTAGVTELELRYTFTDSTVLTNFGPEPCVVLALVGENLQSLTVTVDLKDPYHVALPACALAQALMSHLPLCSGLQELDFYTASSLPDLGGLRHLRQLESCKLWTLDSREGDESQLYPITALHGLTELVLESTDYFPNGVQLSMFAQLSNLQRLSFGNVDFAAPVAHEGNIM